MKKLEWIDRVWLSYIQGKPALLSLDTFTGHLTEKVKAEVWHKVTSYTRRVFQFCSRQTSPFRTYIREVMVSVYG